MYYEDRIRKKRTTKTVYIFKYFSDQRVNNLSWKFQAFRAECVT